LDILKERVDFLDCTKCAQKGCRNGAPCTDNSASYIGEYHTAQNAPVVHAASALVDGGRAGTLTRLEEIAEYCRIRGFKKIGVAYCYALEKEALSLKNYLLQEGFSPLMVSCTVDGVTESAVDPDKTDSSISCNPIGQARAINRSGAQFAVLMGLCLGHDILLQKNLTMDFTVFAVKDRVTGHHPLMGLPDVQPPEDAFLKNMPDDFYLMQPKELALLLENQKSPEDFYLLDLRNEKVFAKNGFSGSINIPLADLPQKYRFLFPDKTKKVVALCGGGLQSLYAVMFLSIKGYRDVRSVRGGFPG
jgi:uncharacterized metal-binding protein/rhodanese-related sulfurtransferase